MVPWRSVHVHDSQSDGSQMLAGRASSQHPSALSRSCPMMMKSVSWASEGACGSAGQSIIAAGMCGQTVLMVSDALSHLHTLRSYSIGGA